jgi:hypothetical protein
MTFRSPFELINIPDAAWRQESTRRILEERAAGPLFRFAQKYGISQTRLGIAVGMSQPYVNDIINGRRGTVTAIESWVRIAEGLNMPDHARMALGLAPATLGKTNATYNDGTAVTEGKRPNDPLPASDISDLTAEVIASDTDGEAIDQLAHTTEYLAETHTQLSAKKVLAEVLRLHGQTQKLLGRRQRLSQKRELFRIESQLLAHACLLFGDLQQDATAEKYGEASLLFAREAGASEATSWTAQAKTLRWQERFVESAEMARRGFDHSALTPVKVQLASQEANAAALLGDASRAREALSRAEATADQVTPDSGISVWSFPVARQAIFSLSVALHTNDPDAALRASAMADDAWKSGVPRVLATWAQVRVGAGIAHLMKGSLDGAIEEVTPVLTLAPELRVATVTAYLKNLDKRLDQQHFEHSNEALALREQIRAFIATSLTLPEDPSMADGG